ncbi:MAG: peptidase M14 [Dysgonamonadaceae bacterium]|jgi:hypothetical protein|nr:peptidase M14 [Dysgonamonadaceae bacterium]
MTKKNILLALAGLLCFQQAYLQPFTEKYPYDIKYFLPEGEYSFNPDIPQPKDVLGFEIGQQHADWNNVLMYMSALENASPRVSIKRFGSSNQFRPFIQVAITSERNQKNLENIRLQHLKLTEAEQSSNLDLNSLPVIVNIMYSVHGNEPSGVNSSLVTAYYLAAMQGEEIEWLLENTVVVLTPGLNPDGINRFASWVNSSRSIPDVADISSREFSEPWPSSRTNHFWADCNRDWLMAQQKEGQNALEMYFEWMANVVCDFHEQGGDRNYYFSPGHPLRTHPLTPQKNQELTSKLTAYSARALDEIGTLYYSKERYDDYYYGKGAAYGDIHGSVCILYEQLAARGHLRPTKNFGIMSFPSTIRNQSFSAFSVIRGACEMKSELLEYQRNYYKEAAEKAKKSAVQGYIFNARGNRAIAWHFLENLKRHRIDVYHLAKNQTINGTEYRAEDSYVIPLAQKYSAMVKTLMENVTEFSDSTFYDISTWTFPHAYNLQYDELKTVSGLAGSRADKDEFPKGRVIGGKSEVAYLFDNSQYYSGRMLAELLRKNLIVKVSSKPFTFSDKKFGFGTILLQTQNQPLDKDELYALTNRLAEDCGVEVYSVKSALMSDYDLGTPYFTPLAAPRVAVITGPGMGVPESGEVWMMLGQRFNIPPTLLDYSALSGVDLNKYNVLIMADGAPSRPVPEAVVSKIKNWISDGGLLITSSSAVLWTNKMKLTDVKIKPALTTQKSNGYRPYSARSEENAGNSVSGVILNCRLDRTHPLAWGYEQDRIAVFRQGTLAFETPENPYNTPLSYLDRPYLSGCISQANLGRLAGTPSVVISSKGKGRIISFADDLNFRMYWFGASKIFLNAVLFGQLL